MAALIDDDGRATELRRPDESGLRRFHVMFEIPHSFYSVARPYSEEIGRFEAHFTDTPEPLIVALTDVRQDIGGAPVHVGIVADVQVSSTDIQQAVQLATQRLEAVLQIGALQSNAAVGVPRLRFALECTAGAPTTEMVQVEERYDDVFTKKRGLDLPAAERIGQAFDQRGTPRIARALHWYRKGLEQEADVALVAFDQSVLEKPESQAALGLCPVRSSKARRLARPRPGFGAGPPRPPVTVPGVHWLAATVMGWSGPAHLSICRWWSPRRSSPSPQRQRESEGQLLRELVARWGTPRPLCLGSRLCRPSLPRAGLGRWRALCGALAQAHLLSSAWWTPHQCLALDSR